MYTLIYLSLYYIYIYMYVSLSLSLYIYICIHIYICVFSSGPPREVSAARTSPERGPRSRHVYVCMYMRIYTYIYIYVYIERERDTYIMIIICPGGGVLTIPGRRVLTIPGLRPGVRLRISFAVWRSGQRWREKKRPGRALLRRVGWNVKSIYNKKQQKEA